MPWCKIYRNLQYLYPSMRLASRILWRKVKSQHLWILSAKCNGPTIRVWSNAPRLFLHEFLKPREEIKDSIQAKKSLWVLMQPNSLYLAFHTHNNCSPALCLLVARVSWPYLQWAGALILSWADAWLSANFRGNTLVYPFDQGHPSLLIMILVTSCRIQYLLLEPGQWLII
jgi:hypothetical protein